MINLKLFIIRDTSPSGICFEISDELGNQKYSAVFKKTKRGVPKNNIRLDIKDSERNAVAKIRQLPIVGVSSFSLKTEKSAATLVVMMSASGVSCRFYGNNWHICGNIASKEFTVIDVDNAVIASQTKQSSGFLLEIPNSDNELLGLAAALCVNMINTVDKPALQTV